MHKITHKGREFIVEIESDDTQAPRKEYDGHGLVSEHEWPHVGVIVTAINNKGKQERLWAVFQDLNDYSAEVARELADEICDTLAESEAAELAEIEVSMQRTREHVRAWLREYRAIVRELGARSFPTLCETARRNLQREILELNAMRHRARELRNLAALGA